jgi:hypothetical protein
VDGIEGMGAKGIACLIEVQFLESIHIPICYVTAIKETLLGCGGCVEVLLPYA